MDRYGATKKVAAWGIGANLFLLFAKLLIGFASGSQAMIADGFNSAGDVFTSVMTYLGNKIASSPQDKDHPYGHGKAEYIFSMIISFSLLVVTYQIFRNSLEFIIKKQSFVFSWQLATVAFITIALKMFLWVYTRRVGEKWDNLLIIANAEDHRNDILVTASTLIGILLEAGVYTGLMGLLYRYLPVDRVYRVRIFISAYNVLMDTNIDENSPTGSSGYRSNKRCGTCRFHKRQAHGSVSSS